MQVQIFSRRNFLKSVGLASSSMIAGSFIFACSGKKDRPNILWITSEDNSPTYVGCYGNKFAATPNIDRLAAEGILYENAFSTAPVCAPTRSTIITGVYPVSMGTQHIRSTNAIPDSIILYPLLLRQAGYYCTNNHKEDYNIPKRSDVWDESSNKATFKNRKPDQPFFAIFNFAESHEHVIHKPLPLKELRHDPAKVELPPYLPDTPEIRHDWAQYYDKVEDMDKRVGEKLDEIKKEGLAEDTIVFYYSDHGGVLPRSKRFCYDTGLKVPMVIRFPKKYQHLAPGKPGTRTDRLVSFVDLPPTLLSLIGAPVAKFLQGSAFVGKEQGKPREYVYSFRGRMDERYDMGCGRSEIKSFAIVRILCRSGFTVSTSGICGRPRQCVPGKKCTKKENVIKFRAFSGSQSLRKNCMTRQPIPGKSTIWPMIRPTGKRFCGCAKRVVTGLWMCAIPVSFLRA
ncbi:MAG: sulfatase-like hydrolase/transferase [Actinobacteria bacterium]|nr:sulfatase-like hydrolase/transferase [Actinomycetota bacterium]